MKNKNISVKTYSPNWNLGHLTEKKEVRFEMTKKYVLVHFSLSGCEAYKVMSFKEYKDWKQRVKALFDSNNIQHKSIYYNETNYFILPTHQDFEELINTKMITQHEAKIVFNLFCPYAKGIGKERDYEYDWGVGSIIFSIDKM